MSAKPAASLDRAGEYVWRNARLVDRAQFNHLFVAASLRSVLAALRAYHNDDAGFGNALEADIRAPSSMPVACELALIILWQAGIRDQSIANALCGYLASVANADGWVPIATRENFRLSARGALDCAAFRGRFAESDRRPRWDAPSSGC